jgi:hypothetical protein
MRVLNGIDPNLATGDVAEVRGALYDRFYVPPAGSIGEQYLWIGNSNDWSGVASNGHARWGTLVAPSFFLSAEHTHPSPDGKVTKVRSTNDKNETALVLTSVDGMKLGEDHWVGQNDQPVTSDFVVYPIFATEESADLIGTELLIFGRSNEYDQFGVGSNLDNSLLQRLGKNVIAGVNETEQYFSWTFDVSIADFAGPNGVGDGEVEHLPGGFEYDLMDAASGSVGNASYFTGDLNGSGSIENFEFSMLGAESGLTGGLGWIEAATVDGDSGGPSFTMVEVIKPDGTPVSKPAVIGTHSAQRSDNIASQQSSDIVNFITQRSGGSEHPCFVSHSRKYILGEHSYRRGGTLEEHVGNLRVFGDITGDYRLDNDDILAMEAEVRAHKEAEATGNSYPYNWGFDLNNDNEINLADFQTLMIKGFKTSPADAVTRTTGLQGETLAGPDGVANALGEGALISSNVGMENPSFFDGDLNLDGEVTFGGDVWVLVQYFEQSGLFRLNLDFDNTGDSAGVLDASDIDALTAHMDIGQENPSPYDDAFDLTTGTVESDGAVVMDEQLAGVADGVVNQADLIFYLEEVLGTSFGDVNLDGTVNVSGDFSPTNNNAANGSGAGWMGGDVNFDGIVDQEDVDLIGAIILGQSEN